jgi:hypothetical protein
MNENARENQVGGSYRCRALDLREGVAGPGPGIGVANIH